MRQAISRTGKAKRPAPCPAMAGPRRVAAANSPPRSRYSELDVDRDGLAGEIEAIITSFKRLLHEHGNALVDEGIDHEIEILEAWLEAYRHGLLAARKIARHGTEWLQNHRNRLQLATNQLSELASEGGTPPTREQVQRAEDNRKVVAVLDEAVPVIQEIGGDPKPEP